MAFRIVGTGSCHGDHVVTNLDLAGIVETSEEWIRTRTGIGSRYLTTGAGTSDMAAQAAKRACENGRVRPEELDLILMATSTPENCFPCGACEVQGRIGAVNAAAFDISAACSGFLFALQTANSFLSSGVFRKILVIGADDLSKITDWEDRETCILFGDGAGAVVVQEEKEGFFHGVMRADGSRGHVLTCTARSGGNFLTQRTPAFGYTSMDGREVFRFAVREVPECIKQLLERQGIQTEEIRYYVLHQANERIIEAVARRLGEPMDKFPMNIQKYGNTSAATIPILLDEMNQAGQLKRGDKVVLAGFGGGLTWGAAVLEW